ncbi:MAG: alpha/beta fold hydrolase [Chloroflexota bacterium]
MPEYEYTPGFSLFYLDQDPQASDAVVLLHGLGASGISWQYQLPMLQACGFRALAPDLPGFGRSPYRRGSPRLPAMSQAVCALLDQLKLERVALVGISMGGCVALQLALDHPARVERLALINTFARLGVFHLANLPYYLTRLALIYSLGLERQAKTVARRVFPKPGQEALRVGLIAQILEADPAAYRATMTALARFNVERRLGEIRVPTLVVSGEEDTTVAQEAQQRLANGIHGAQHIDVPNAGHGVTAEQPEALNHILADFLRR